MAGLRSALLEWDWNRVARVIVSGLAVFLALRLTDGFVTGLGATFLFLFLFTVPWEIATRLLDRLRAS